MSVEQLNLTLLLYDAQCVLCKVYFSAQPNKLKHILKFRKYYPIEHIFVPACSSARKIHCIHYRNMSKYVTVSTTNTWDTKYVTVSNTWAIKDTVTSYLTKYTLCTVIFTSLTNRVFVKRFWRGLERFIYVCKQFWKASQILFSIKESPMVQKFNVYFSYNNLQIWKGVHACSW